MIIIAQFSFFGFHYYSVVDDNNQFGIYNLRNDNIAENILQKYTNYSVRPLAFLSDVFVFQWFWGNMYVLLILVLLMHLGSIYLIYKIADKIDIHLNAFCLTFFALSPILIEAVYWISASTRIVVSTFLCLLSIYLLLLYFDETSKNKKIALLISTIILNFICVGYYEQTIALNLFLFVFVLICTKKYKYIYIPAISTTWIGAWYVYFMAHGQMQSRGALNIMGIFSNAKNVASEIVRIYNVAYQNFRYSLGFGKETILSSLVTILLFVIIACFIYNIFKKESAISDEKGLLKKLLLGLIIFISPFLPFIVLQSSSIYTRNFYIPTLGLAIIIGTALDFIFKFVKNRIIINIVKTSVIGIITVLFVVSNIDGVNNYKKVHEFDNKIAFQIIEALDDEIFKDKKSISINYNDKKIQQYKNLSNFVESVIESDWATAGKLQVMRNKVGVGNIYINTKQEEADINLFFDDDFSLNKVIEKGEIDE